MKKILLINIALFVPCLIISIAFLGTGFPYHSLVFIFSLINLFISHGKKEFLLCSLILLIGLTAAFFIDFYLTKIGGVGYHPEKLDELGLLVRLNTVYMFFISAAGVVVKHIKITEK